jgi:TonB family protein
LRFEAEARVAAEASRRQAEAAAAMARQAAQAALPPPPAPAEPPRPGLQVPLPTPGLRRRTLVNRTDRDPAVVMYAEGWRQKIEVHATPDEIKGVPAGSFESPLVTVALRSDGTVESVTINRSSGSAAVDDAVKRIVQQQAPYARFPAGLAQDLDVLEIRRVWTFEAAVRLFPGTR